MEMVERLIYKASREQTGNDKTQNFGFESHPLRDQDPRKIKAPRVLFCQNVVKVP